MYNIQNYNNLCDKVQACERCILNKHKFNHKITGRKTKLSLEFLKSKCLILWIGQNPYHADRTDLEKHKLQSFGQTDGKILRKLCGSELLDCSAFTNLIRCSIDSKIKDEYINQCLWWLRLELDFINPKYIIFLGKIAANYFHKNFGDVLEKNDKTIFFLPHPGAFKYQKNKLFESMYKNAALTIKKENYGIFNT